MRATRRSILRRVLSTPTAPLFEADVAEVVAALAERAGLNVTTDGAGNVVARVPGAGDSPPLVFVAHLDHPGFAIDAVEGPVAALTFRGGVRAGFAAVGTGVTFHRPGARRATGRGVLESVAEDGGSLRAAVASVVEGRAYPGGFAMWDVGEVDVGTGLIAGPVCDDLAGVSAALCALTEARGRPAGGPVIAVFTRAEEVGFLGTLEAIRLGSAPRRSVVLSLECSKALPEAPQGGGVIVRVGDRMSIFDPDVTAGLVVAATEVGGAARAFRWQRRLMDGGACEATAFCASGFRASGLALPLANYHNMSDPGGGIAAEAVEVADFEAEVDLLGHLIAHPELVTGRKGRRRPDWLTGLAGEARGALRPR